MKRGRGSSGARNWIDKKKMIKKKGTTTTGSGTSTTSFAPGQTIRFLVKVFTFLPFNLQKRFLMISTSTIYPKDVLRK
jgi:hypothetical protein